MPVYLIYYLEDNVCTTWALKSPLTVGEPTIFIWVVDRLNDIATRLKVKGTMFGTVQLKKKNIGYFKRNYLMMMAKIITSSELSPQSFSPSHKKLLLMHFPFEQ